MATDVRLQAAGGYSRLNLTGKTLIQLAPCTLMRIIVNTAPSVAGGIYDTATVSSTPVTKLVMAIPTTIAVATPFYLVWPFLLGLVIDPGTGGVVSFCWNNE